MRQRVRHRYNGGGIMHAGSRAQITVARFLTALTAGTISLPACSIGGTGSLPGTGAQSKSTQCGTQEPMAVRESRGLGTQFGTCSTPPPGPDPAPAPVGAPPPGGTSNPPPGGGGVTRVPRDLTRRVYYQNGGFYVDCDVYSVVVSAVATTTGVSGDPGTTILPVTSIVGPGIQATFFFKSPVPFGNTIAVSYTSSGPNAIPPATCGGSL
jgi:hypothetical protein